jgi:hypothetical protein
MVNEQHAEGDQEYDLAQPNLKICVVRRLFEKDTIEMETDFFPEILLIDRNTIYKILRSHDVEWIADT